jgi:hypothetical protein
MFHQHASASDFCERCDSVLCVFATRNCPVRSFRRCQSVQSYASLWDDVPCQSKERQRVWIRTALNDVRPDSVFREGTLAMSSHAAFSSFVLPTRIGINQMSFLSLRLGPQGW